MTDNTTYSYIFKILTQAYHVMDCDFRFVLHNILCRGAEEANYLSFQFEGEEGEKLRRDKIYLEGIISDLPHMLDREGNALHCHRATIRGAVTLASNLIAIEREQTAGQLDMLDERLRNPRRSRDRQMSRAA